MEYTAEYQIREENQTVLIRFRLRAVDFKRYFDDFENADPFGKQEAIEILDAAAAEVGGVAVKDFSLEKDSLSVKITTTETMQAFVDSVLNHLEEFYEKNEAHITRMFGSFVYLKKINGELKAVKATPVPIQYCPLMKQLLLEVGGETAEHLMDSLASGDSASQSEMMCRLINEVVIKGGYFDTSRPLNSCEANVMFGASETMSTAFRSGLIDAAVIVSNNLGTIITTNESNTQGAVQRMTGLFMTSPSKEIVQTAREAKIIPVFPHTAVIDQLEGVRQAIALGYKKIAVSVAWRDNILLNEINGLEQDGVVLYKLGLCSTGIDHETATAMKNHADVVWACASKVVREYIEPNAIVQVGVKIPVYIMSEKGWELIKNHLILTGKDQHKKADTFEQVERKKGKDRPVILNDIGRYRIIPARELRECRNCPHPCV